jgi:hypothetical protein
MNTKLITVIASVVALGLGSSPAWAGNGQFQAVGQKAITGQKANANANAGQNAVNANVPVTIAGGNVTGGNSSANQKAANIGAAAAVNASHTGQQATANQTGGSSACKAGCGGSGQYQAVGQKAATLQGAKADADANQNAVNANVPVTIAGGNVSGGSSSANQAALNAAGAAAVNASKTDQKATATQTGGSSSCLYGCGGSGQYQVVDQEAATLQLAHADADANQNAVNANTPVTIAGGNVTGGSSSANQGALNAAGALAANVSDTNQNATATQTGGSSSCLYGCGGSGQYQAVDQKAATLQLAHADADANQNAINGNAPVTIAGGDVIGVRGSDSSANQKAANIGAAAAVNASHTGQQATATQTGGKSSCYAGCGGSGQYQAIGQHALTLQGAWADADAYQNAVNGNAPVTVAGGNVYGGSSSANQFAGNAAKALSLNLAGTWQTATATQNG